MRSSVSSDIFELVVEFTTQDPCSSLAREVITTVCGMSEDTMVI